MGKTITTYLIDENPQGSQYSFISNRTCKMYLIPRANIALVNEREELQRPAFYILIGENERLDPKAYLGETENFKDRVKDHDSKKDFWQKALIFISKDGDITKADVQYLEYLGINEAKKAKQYDIEENKQKPNAPNLPEHQRDTMDSFFEDIKLLTSFTGYKIFDIVEQKKNNHIFMTKSRDIDARGFYSENGFTVLKGSIIANTVTQSFSWKEKREKLVESLAKEEKGILTLQQDYTFSSPSTASDFCLGRSSNGWTTWKDKSEKTLDEVYRNKLE